MSDSSLTEADPVLKMYEAQAIVVEKEQELKEKDAEIAEKNKEIEVKNGNLREKDVEIERMRQDIGRFRVENNSNKNQQELTRKAIKQEKLRNQQNLNEKQSESEQTSSVLILGGWFSLNSIYLLDSKAQSWKQLRITLPIGMHGFGAVVLNEELFIFGGYANSYQYDCYKLKNGESWMKLASLNQSRSNISSSSLVYKGDIWAIGGDSDENLKSVEKYDIAQDKWTYMPEMNYARQDTAAAVYKDRIFVTGGWNFEKILKSMEMFDPKLQKWILFCDLPIEVVNHTMLISNSTLSIFGGYSEYGPVNSIWEMDMEDPEKKWTEKQSFKHPRGSFGIGKLSNEIIVFGDYGINGKTSEIFDGNEWIDGPKLPQYLSRFAYTSIPQSIEESFLEKFL